jgi:stress response protein SCP2
MAITRTDYTAAAVAAARSVMLELTHLLAEYRDGIVIVGGWVPELLLTNASQPHTGSLDVDLALDHRTLTEIGYKTILQLLLSRGYRQGEQPFIFYRTLQIDENSYEVEVDFLAGEYAGTTRNHRTQKVQDMQPRKARGCDLAFSQTVEIILSGNLPDGGKDSNRIQVASIPSFLVMKSIVLATRLKEKDAWDIYFCIRNYPGGIDALAEEFQPLLENKLTQEALENLAEKFASPDHIGPKHIADFEGATDNEERAFLQRDAFERINALLVLLR